jgi:hypothetical protein
MLKMHWKDKNPHAVLLVSPHWKLKYFCSPPSPLIDLRHIQFPTYHPQVKKLHDIPQLAGLVPLH